MDDIKSFNITTREIVFSDSIPEKLSRLSMADGVRYDRLTIYCGDKLLFEKINITNLSSSRSVNDLVLIELSYKSSEEYIFILADGYPHDWKDEQILIGSGNMPIDWKKLRKENAEKRKTEWDIFIKYLTDAGKIVE